MGIIYCATPCYDGVSANTFHAKSFATRKHTLLWNACVGSLQGHSCNELWCAALNCRKDLGITHLLMLHADVAPLETYWVDLLYDELEAHRLDALSVCVPMKNEDGYTSTGFYNPSNHFLRRLTMTELHQIHSQTFDAKEAGHSDCQIILNTGLMLCRFDQDWVEKVWFEVRDRIVKTEDGKFRAETLPEDWYFSFMLHSLGLRAKATKAVAVTHTGQYDFRSDIPWGNRETETHPLSFACWQDVIRRAPTV